MSMHACSHQASQAYLSTHKETCTLAAFDVMLFTDYQLSLCVCKHVVEIAGAQFWPTCVWSSLAMASHS